MAPKTVRCRPLTLLAVSWVFGLVLTAVLIAALRAAPSPPRENFVICLLTSPLLLGALGAGCWAMRAEVLADESGFRWRGFGRWRSVEWREVADYYESGARHSQRGTVVETARGRVIVGGDWSGVNDLRGVVAQSATRARAQGWALKGTRIQDDWPRIFHYDTKENCRILASLPATIVLVTAGAIWLVADRAIRLPKLAAEIGWGMASGALLVFVVLMAAYAALYLAFFPPLLETRRRREERIIGSPNGIRFERPGRSVMACWPEIQDYFLAPAAGPSALVRHVVRATGGTFDFAQTIGDAPVLRAIIERYATRVPEPGWRTVDDDVLGGEGSRWSGGQLGADERIYHYRTRTNRALMAIPAAFALGTALQAVFSACGLLAARNWRTEVVVAAALGALTFWGWWRYRAAAVRTDEHGITQETLFGRQHLAWAEVERYFTSGGDVLKFGNVAGAGRRIRFWLLIGDAQELKAAVARRAYRSHNREWER